MQSIPTDHSSPSSYQSSSSLPTGRRQFLSDTYDRYAPAIYGCLVRKIPDETVAGEILHKVFISAWVQQQEINNGENKLFLHLLRRTVEIARTEHNIIFTPADIAMRRP